MKDMSGFKVERVLLHVKCSSRPREESNTGRKEEIKVERTNLDVKISLYLATKVSLKRIDFVDGDDRKEVFAFFLFFFFFSRSLSHKSVVLSSGRVHT